MEIKLQRVGGILPVMKEAATEVDWSEEELRNLLGDIGVDEQRDTPSRDATSHYLEVQGNATPVDLKKIPPKYKPTFEELKANLKFVKT